MAEKIYLVRDNGLRCFTPPCFSWDIVELDSQRVGTASALDISMLALNPEQANQVMAALAKGQCRVKGYTVEYAVKLSEELPPEKGIRFVVMQMIDP